MGEVTSYTKVRIDEIQDASVVDGDLVGETLVLTKGDASTIDIILSSLTGDSVSQAELDDAIAALVDSSPAALNTLNELAAALGDDANFASTITAAIALKANLQETVNDHGNTGSAYTLPDITVATIHNVTLNAATVTFTMPTPLAGKSFVVNVKQDGTGGRLAVFTGVVWAGGVAPTLTTTAGKVDELVFRCSDAAAGWRGSLGGANFAS